MPTTSGDPVLSHRTRRGIAWRLALALGTAILMLGVVSAICIWALFDVHRRLHSVKRDEERARGVVELASAVRDQYAHVAHTIIIGNDSHAELFRLASRKLLTLAGTVRAQAGLRGAPEEVDRIVAASREIGQLFEMQILPLVRAGDHAALVVRHERILSLALSGQSQAEDLARKAEAAMEDLGRHVNATQHGAIRLTIIAHLFSLLTAAAVGIYVYRSIARPITMLSAATARVGTGDLDTEIGIEREDELGRLARRFNEMMKSVKDHQQKLLNAERLAGLGSVVAGIAHELNNPIGVILGYAKLLLRREGAPDAKTLAAIEEEAERCHQVIEGLLELTRGSVLRTTAVDLRALADDVVSRLRVSGTSSLLPVEIRGQSTAMGDEAKLRQVFTNLICNATEACGTDGRVIVTIGRSGPNRVSVRFADTGAGVKASDRDHIFEPFFTTKPTGTGLGLAISRAIARSHGGDVALLADVSATTFELTLPETRSLPNDS